MLKGAIAVELLKQEISKYLEENNQLFKVSMVNSYIAGSKFEYDLLIVKKSANPYMGLVYSPEDVIAVIESKAGGLFSLESNTDNIAKAMNCAYQINSNIRFGYITMSENVPVNEYKKDGNPTVKHWDLTIKYLTEKVQGLIACYAVTLHQGKSLYDEGLDEEFTDFVNFLIELR